MSIVNPYFAAVRGVSHAIGLKLSKERRFNQRPASIGIWAWIDQVIREVESMKKLGYWDYQVPDISTVERRIRELADKRIQDPPLWLRLSKKYPDIDGRTGHVRIQSTYLPNDLP